MSGYHGTIFFPAGAIEITEEGGVNVQIHDGRTFTAEEFAASAVISEVLSKLRNGKFVDYSFDVKSFEDISSLVKCEWLKTNNLAIRGPANKEYDHANSVEEAIKKHRTFTCTKAISLLIPKHREFKAAE